MKTLVETCLYFVGEKAALFSASAIQDIPVSLLRQLLPYLSAYELHRLHTVFTDKGVNVDFVWEAHLHKRWPQTYQQTVQIFHDSPRPDSRQQYLEKHFHELLRFSHFKQHLDPLGKMNTSLYNLELCAVTGFPPHTSMSELNLKQVLHHYSEHVARLSIMGLQCGLILDDDELVNTLKDKVHTVNLHHIQDKFFTQTRRLLLKLLEGNTLQQVTLYHVWLSDENLHNLLSICAGLPTKEPPERELQVPSETLISQHDLTIAHPEHTTDQNLCDTSPPKRKRMKLLKHPLKKASTALAEVSGGRTSITNYDFKCSKFCFKKCQCDVRLSQDFEPGSSGNVDGAKNSLSPKSKRSSPSHAPENLSQERQWKISTPRTEQHTNQELDLFDEAVALSGSLQIGEICDSLCDNSSGYCEAVRTNCKNVGKFESDPIYEDLDYLNDGPSTSNGKKKQTCICGVITNRGLEGLAVVSTGAKSLTSHLVNILPNWNNLKKFALIHTAVTSWDLREVLLEKIRRGHLTHLIVEDTFLSPHIFDFIADSASADRRTPMQLYRCSNSMQELAHNLFELEDTTIFQGITHLDLSYNSFDNSGLNLLCAIIRNSSTLNKLELRRCQLRENSLKSVLRSIQDNGNLESLNLAENVLWETAEMEMVVTLNKLSCLRSLNISSCAFSLQLVGGDDFLNAIAYHPNLCKLYLSGNWIRDVGCKVLLRVCSARIQRRCKSGIHCLNLGFSGMHAEGLLAVAEEIRRQALQEDIQAPLLDSLDLSGNPVASQQAQIRNGFQYIVRQLRVDTYGGDIPLSDHIAQM